MANNNITKFALTNCAYALVDPSNKTSAFTKKCLKEFGVVETLESITATHRAVYESVCVLNTERERLNTSDETDEGKKVLNALHKNVVDAVNACNKMYAVRPGKRENDPMRPFTPCDFAEVSIISELCERARCDSVKNATTEQVVNKFMRYYAHEVVRILDGKPYVRMTDEDYSKSVAFVNAEKARKARETKAKKDIETAEQEQTIAEQEQTIAEQEQTIAEQEQTIANAVDAIAEIIALVEKSSATVLEKAEIIGKLKAINLK